MRVDARQSQVSGTELGYFGSPENAGLRASIYSITARTLVLGVPRAYTARAKCPRVNSGPVIARIALGSGVLPAARASRASR